MLYENYGAYAHYKEKSKIKKPRHAMLYYHRIFSTFKFVLGLLPKNSTGWYYDEIRMVKDLISRDMYSAYHSIDPDLRKSLIYFSDDFFSSESSKAIELHEAMEIILLTDKLFVFIKKYLNENKCLIKELISAYNSRSLIDIKKLEAKTIFLKELVDWFVSSKRCFDTDWFEALVGFASEQYGLNGGVKILCDYLGNIKKISCGLPLDASNYKVDHKARIIAGEIRGLIKNGADNAQNKIKSLIQKKFKINGFKDCSKTKFDIRKLSSKKYWVDFFWGSLLEAQYELSRVVGLVGTGYCQYARHISKSPYVPEFIFKIYRDKEKYLNSYLSKNYLISADGASKKSLKQIVDHKKKGQAAEMALFIKAQSYFCQNIKGWGAYLLTVTLPSHYHAQRSVCNGEYVWNAFNPNFSGKTVKMGYVWGRECFKKFRHRMQKKFGKKGWNYFLFVEMHKDGTPHWHAVLYFPIGHEAFVRDLVISVFVLEQKGRIKKDINLIDPSVLRHQIQLERFRERHGAERYAIKMTSKVLDNEEEDLKIKSYYSMLRIRRYDSSFQNKGMWRALRYTQDPDLIPDELREAWHYARGIKNKLPRLNDIPKSFRLIKKNKLPIRSFDSNASCTVMDVVGFMIECPDGYSKIKAKDKIDQIVVGSNISCFFSFSSKKYHKDVWRRLDKDTGEIFIALFLRRRWVGEKNKINYYSVNSSTKERDVSLNDKFME